MFQLLAKCAFFILFHFIVYFISALFQLTKTVLIVTFWEKAGNKNSSFNHPNVHASPYDLFLCVVCFIQCFLLHIIKVNFWFVGKLQKVYKKHNKSAINREAWTILHVFWRLTAALYCKHRLSQNINIYIIYTTWDLEQHQGENDDRIDFYPNNNNNTQTVAAPAGDAQYCTPGLYKECAHPALGKLTFITNQSHKHSLSFRGALILMFAVL